MKKLFVNTALLGSMVIALSIAGMAQGKGANFSGTWELDKSKSQLPQMMADRIQSQTWTITQDDKELTRETKTEMAGGGPGGGPGGGGGGRGMGMGGPQKLTLKLDGSETVTENPRGKTTFKVKWMDGGKILEVSSVANLSTPNGDFTLTTTEHWELTDGGKSLKVHQTRETPQGSMEATMVYVKK